MSDSIEGLEVRTLKEGADERGVVREFFRMSQWDGTPWQQINVTETRAGAIRGLHGEAMTKLVAVVSGSAIGAYVDARHGSPTFGNVMTVPLQPGVQVLVPRGVCNGFQSITDTVYVYCFDDEWKPGMAGVAVSPLDPALGIDWPIAVDRSDRAQLSEKDATLPTFEQATAVGRDANS